MSQDKLLCTGTSRDKMNFKNFKKRTDFLFQNIIFLFWNILSCYRTSFPVFDHHLAVIERPFLLCPILFFVPSRFLAIPARPVPNFGFPGPSQPLARFLACPVVPLSQDNEGTSVPLSRNLHGPSRWKPQFKLI